jgi:CheY-like chemotaxis protein
MPGTDGWGVLEALRRDPDTAAIPVLIISATDDQDLAQIVGADGFLPKPVNPQILLDHVKRLLSRQELIR